MKLKSKKTVFNPYTSIVLQKGSGLLKDILSSKDATFYRKIDKPIIIYGAGNFGKMAKDFLDYFGLPFLYVIDRSADKYKEDKFWSGTKIITPDEASESDKANSLLVICVLTSPLINLRDELKRGGWKDISFFYDISEIYRNKYPLSNGWYLKKLNKKDKENIKKVYSYLSDEKSRSYYLRFLAWRKLRVEVLFEDKDKSISNDNRFFIPEVLDVLGNDEVFADCGAHKGSVTEKFLKITGNKYNSIYAIEPDKASFEILKKQFGNIPRIKFLKCALNNKNSKEKFCDGFDFASKLSKNGKSLIKTSKLDSLSIEATFIKMHLEGGELNALKGSIKTIQKNRPIIAVTLYHNSDGVWKIPLFLVGNTKNYKYHFRTHSWGGTGTVFYAIPKEKRAHKIN